MRRFNFFVVLVGFCIYCCTELRAQGQLSLYQLHSSLSQSNQLNAAFFPDYKVVVGLPAISSIRFFADNDGLSFNELFIYNESNQLELDTANLPDLVKDLNKTRYNFATQLLYVGLRMKRNHFSLALNQKNDILFNYPGEAVRWAIRGPADPRVANSAISLSDLKARAISYNEVALGYGRQINDRLTVGMRLKYLLGVGAFETEDVNATVYAGIDSVTLANGALTANTSGFTLFEEDNTNVSSYFTPGGNNGFAIDIGGRYQFNDRLAFSAAFNDLGFITWRDHTKSYEIDPVYYTYAGFGVLDFLNNNADNQFLQSQLDSLEGLYDPREVEGNSFTTSLTANAYLAAHYRLAKKHHLGGTLYFDLFDGRVDTQVGISYNLQIGHIFSALVGVSYANGSIGNVGLGMAVKLGNVQFFGTSEKFNSTFYPARASRLDAHAGMNLVFGKIQPDEGPEDKVREEHDPQEVDKTAIVREEAPIEDEVKTEQQVTEQPGKEIMRSLQENMQPQEEGVAAEPVVVSEPEAGPAEEPEQLVQRPVKEEQIAQEREEVRKEVPVRKTERPRDVVVLKRGEHRNELAASHYVIVGVFSYENNARRYSEMLKKAGYDNGFGYVSAKGAYYVYVAGSADLEEVRSKRDAFRKINKFEFPKAWALTVEE